MATESRTLQIVAKVVDQLTGPFGKMGLAIGGFVKGAAGGLQKFVASVFSMKTAIAGVVASLAAFAGAQRLGALAEDAEALDRVARSAGTTVEELSRLRTAFFFGDIDAEGFGSTLDAFVKLAGKAAGGSEKAAQTLRDLGLSFDDLRTKAPSALFGQMADTVSRYATEQDKALVLQRAFPDTFRELVPLLGQGREAFERLVDQADRFGGTITGTDVAVAGKFGESMKALRVAIESVGRAMTTAFGADLAVLLERLAAAIASNRDGIVDLAREIGSRIAEAIAISIRAVAALVDAIDAIPGVDLSGLDAMRAQADALQKAAEEQLATFERFRQNAFTQDLAEKARVEYARLQGQLVSLRIEIGRLEDSGASVGDRIRATLDEITAAVQAARTATPSDDEVAKAWAQYATKMEAAMAGRPLAAPPLAVPSIAAGGGGDADDERVAVRQREAATWDERRAKALAEQVSLIEGMRRGFLAASDEWQNFGRVGEGVGNLLDSALGGVADALGDIQNNTASLSGAWAKLKDQLLQQLQALINRLIVMWIWQQAVGLVSGAVGGGASAGGGVPLEDGGVMRGRRVQAFAGGGIARGPTLALFGEGRNAEAFVPLPDGRSIPVTMQGGGGGGGETNIYIQATDVDSFRKHLARSAGTVSEIVRGRMRFDRPLMDAVRKGVS